MTRKPLSLLFGGLMLSLTLATAADAGSLTYIVPIESQYQPGYFPEFNPMLGTLFSVSVVTNVTAGGSCFFQDAVSSVEVAAFVGFTGFPPSGPDQVLGSSFGIATENFSSPQTLITAIVDFGYTYFVQDLSSFYGTELVNVHAFTSISAVGEPGPMGQFFEMPDVEGSLTVTYTFGAPEPSSLLIAATGAVVLLGSGCWRRFRSAA